MAKAKSKKPKPKEVTNEAEEINYDFIDKPRFSCAFGGAYTTITAIPGYLPIIHGGPGCGVQIQMGQTFLGGFRGSAHLSGLSTPSTNLYENEVIFGGEERLDEQIGTTLELYDEEHVVVLTACVPELIGDDVPGVLKKYEDKVKISHASTAGFKGTSYDGYELLLDSFVDQVVKKGRKRKKLVNVLGIVPSQDVFWEGNLIEIERLLNKAGLEVNTLFNGKDIEDLSKAALNIVLSPWVGVEAAKKLEDKFGTPYIVNPLPIGVAKTSEFLRAVGDALEIDFEKIIEEEEEKAYWGIEKVSDFIIDFDLQTKFATISDSNYAIAVNDFFVKEIGWIPYVAIINDAVDKK
ncbi:MAG: nitrogenase, partial [Methanobrevibacter sp.]|nr:nitrogenase [Methanobrevibacter sp.]